MANLSLWYIPGNGLISPLLPDQPRNTGKKWKSLLVSVRKSLKMANTDLTQRLKANAMIKGKNNNNKAATLHVHDTCITIDHVRYIKILTWLRGFRVIFRYLVWFSLCLCAFVLKPLLGIARQWSREKFAILTLKPQSHVRIFMYRTWAFLRGLL